MNIGSLETFVEQLFIPDDEFACGERVLLASDERHQMLQLTADGEARLATDVAFAGLLEVVSEYIENNKPMRVGRNLPEVLPTATLLKSTDKKKRNFVYTAGQPNDIVVRTNGNTTESQAQFDVMAWLHTSLEDTPPTDKGVLLRVPTQYALLQTSTGINVHFQERVQGAPPLTIDSILTDQDRFDMLSVAAPIRAHLHYLLGDNASLVNDICENEHVTNLRMNEDICYIIDQPHLGKKAARNVVLNGLRRLVGDSAFQEFYKGCQTTSMLDETLAAGF